MTDDNNNTPPTPEPTPTPEPSGTLDQAAADAVKPPDNPKVALAQDLTADQMQQVERAISQAIDGAQKKWSEKQDQTLQTKGYLTPEQAKEIAAQEVQVAEARAQAKMNINNWLSAEGIDPTSDEGEKVFKEYKDGLEAGIYTNKMLLDARGVKFLVQAAGLAPEASNTTENLPTSVPIEIKTTTEDGKPLSRAEMRQKVKENAQETVKQLQAAQRQRRGG